ncbi:hypothetical protein ABIB80_004613 [Bradyrhizobium sp. i1.15.2]
MEGVTCDRRPIAISFALACASAQDAQQTKIVAGFAAGAVADVLAPIYADSKRCLNNVTMSRTGRAVSGMVAVAAVSLSRLRTARTCLPRANWCFAVAPPTFPVISSTHTCVFS